MGGSTGPGAGGKANPAPEPAGEQQEPLTQSWAPTRQGTCNERPQRAQAFTSTNWWQMADETRVGGIHQPRDQQLLSFCSDTPEVTFPS